MIIETYRGYAIDDVGYGQESRYNVNFGGGWSGYSSVDSAKRAIDNFLPMPAPAPVNYFPSDEDVTEAQVIAYQQNNPTPSPAVVPPLPVPVPLPAGTITAAPTTGAGETGTGALPACTNDIDGLTGWYAHTCQGKPVFSPKYCDPVTLKDEFGNPCIYYEKNHQPTTGKTFWDVFSFEDSKSKLWIALIAVGAFLVFSRR